MQLAQPPGVSLPPAGLELYHGEEEVSVLRQRIESTEGLPVYGVQNSVRKPG
ncbi:hypothetical protein [Tatumella sp. UBA2305]|uniref:hypothetical protein n=1 Tax=Tatumella sp. UBA2305 TaxID=1947647 RepID=UPI0025F76F40|nr:hypothetical protein [Tatumella sp. UBA2305]